MTRSDRQCASWRPAGDTQEAVDQIRRDILRGLVSLRGGENLRGPQLAPDEGEGVAEGRQRLGAPADALDLDPVPLARVEDGERNVRLVVHRWPIELRARDDVELAALVHDGHLDPGRLRPGGVPHHPGTCERRGDHGGSAQKAASAER